MKMADLKRKHSFEFNAFPIGFAFNKEQFKAMMERFGLSEDDADKVVSIGSGGFIRKVDVPDFVAMLRRFKEEERQLRKAIKAAKLAEKTA